MECSPSCHCHPNLERIRECNIVKRLPLCNPQIQNGVMIVNPTSGMVLDASCHEVKLQCYTGNTSQLWHLECTRNGNFFIINIGNGKVLSIEGGVTSSANLITSEKHGGVNQQWSINHCDNTIVNSCSNLVIDIKEECFCPGTNLIAFPKHGRDNQKFCLQYA
ncbi:uncharacterized protein LOC135134027 [Zophobas morio]|uniref:uncharacterized protein LOC135134027 n=1 Tax=Zophobas morio TaxID=2755281 RepID=UPI003083622F